MAKRSQRAASQADAAAEDIGAIAPTGGAAADQHLVVFRIADHRFGFRLDDVDESFGSASRPHAARPAKPRRSRQSAGEVLPVVSLRRLLSVPEAPRDDAARVIVLDGDARVGFIVDRIDNLARFRRIAWSRKRRGGWRRSGCSGWRRPRRGR